MKAGTFHLELITPCFSGGAEPGKQAEIRAPSIRGQLRWWFRTLGGFKSLAGIAVPEQEAMIFGSISGDEGMASRLIVRVRGEGGSRLLSNQPKDADSMNAHVGTERGYLLFPLRNNPRAVFDQPSLPRFELSLVWRGDSALWSDLQALVSVFGNLGALGFRSRRAMGALAITNAPVSLAAALSRFCHQSLLVVRSLPATSSSHAIAVLAGWLRGWRSHGRTGNNAAERAMPGYEYAKKDHDIAASRLRGTAFRPALGLPIVSKYGDWNLGSGRNGQTKGRFASPVLLRPHRDDQGKWRALVMFLDAHKWPAGREAFLNGGPCPVSSELYERMKNDAKLELPY